MAPDNQVVDKVHHQLAEDYCKLVPGYQLTPFGSRSYLGDVHGAQRGSKSDAQTSEHAVAVEGHQKAAGCNAFGEEEELGIP